MYIMSHYNKTTCHDMSGNRCRFARGSEVHKVCIPATNTNETSRNENNNHYLHVEIAV